MKKIKLDSIYYIDKITGIKKKINEGDYYEGYKVIKFN